METTPDKTPKPAETSAEFLQFLYENGLITQKTLQSLHKITAKHQSVEDILQYLLDSGHIAEDIANAAMMEFYQRSPSLTEQEKSNSNLFPPIRERFHRYTLLRELGSGGMGKVYMALDSELNREVALKIMKVVDQSERFFEEARAIAKLQHPNIIHIYDIGHYQGFYYYTMDYVAGRTLTEALKEGLSFQEGIQIFHKIVSVVSYIHDKDIVHRDLKPDNILLTENNDPIVVDFGLVKNLRNQKKSHSGIILGTPYYMSPEQASAKAITKASDIFSLGVILYEMLTGVNPFFSDNIPQILVNISFHDPPNPRSIRSSIPVDIETICLKCIEKQAGSRYSSAQELAADIERFQNNEVIHARPASFWRKFYKFVQNNKHLVATVAFIVMIVIAIVVSYIVILQRFSALRQREVRAANIRLAEIARSKADQSYQEGLWREAGAYSGVALEYLKPYSGKDVAELKEYNKQAVRLSLERDSLLWSKKFPHQVYLDRHHDQLIHIKDGIKIYDIETEKLLLHSPGFSSDKIHIVRPPFLSNNGNFLSVNSLTEVIAIWDLQKKQPVVSDDPDLINAFQFSKNSRMAYIVSKGKILYYDLQKKTAKPFEYGAKISSDGRIGVGTSGHNIVVYDTVAKKRLHLLRGHSNLVQKILCSRDNRTLISCSLDGTVRFWDIQSGRQTRLLDIGGRDPIYTFALTDSEQILAAGHLSGKIAFWDLRFGTVPFKIVHERNAKRMVTLNFSHDDRFLYSQDVEGKISCWHVFYKKHLFSLSGYKVYDHIKLALNHDETILASAFLKKQKVVKLWHLPTQRLLNELINPEVISKFCFHPQENLLLCAAEKKMYLWNTTTSKMKITLDYHQAKVTAVLLTSQSLLISADASGVLIVYDLLAQKIKHRFTYKDPIYVLGASASGETIVFANEHVFLWPVITEKPRTILTRKQLSLELEKFISFAFIDQDNLLLVTKNKHHQSYIYNMKTRQIKPLVRLYGPECNIRDFGVINYNNLIDIDSERPLQSFFTSWTTRVDSLVTKTDKLINTTLKGNIHVFKLPHPSHYQGKVLPEWASNFPEASKKKPHTSRFDFRKDVPGWFIEKALEESPQKTTKFLFGLEIDANLHKKELGK